MSETSTFIFLSSGASQRYRDDVLRAIALPRGAYLQFRYHVGSYVARAIRDNLAKGGAPSLVGRRALLCSLDRKLAPGATVMGSFAGAEKLAGPPGKPQLPEVVPCRYARVAEIDVLGDAVFVRFSLEGFPVVADAEKFNATLRGESEVARGRVPKWEAKGSEFEVLGEFWLERNEIPGECVESTNRAGDIAAFQKVVDRLGAHAEYSKEAAYFHLIGLRSRTEMRLQDSAYIVPKQGRFSAPKDKWLSVDVFHYEPKGVQPKGRVEVSATIEQVQFDGPSVIHIDSSYDLAEVRLRLPVTIVEQRGVVDLKLYRDSDAVPVLMMELSVLAPASRARFVGAALLVAASIFAANAITTLTREGFTWETGRLVLLLQFLAAVVVGVVAAFGLKKPL